MKNIAVLLTFLMVSNLALYADNSLDKGTISGRVIDSKSNEALPYVNIIIKSQSGEIITGAITDQDGVFEISNIKETTVIVSVQYIGYKTLNKEVTLSRGKNKLDLGTLVLEEDQTALDEVTIIAETSSIQQKVDRKVITIGKDLTTQGATASDIMNNLPSVSVDSQSGNISLRGNENVRVLVDGKPTNVPAAQLLKQIPSTSIKSVELITNPSAKYNPEGMSGIINIILHKNTKVGFNGSLNIGLSKEINANFNSSIDMNYRNGKFNFYGNYGNAIGKSSNNGFINRLDDNTRQLFTFGNNNKSHLFKVGVDYYINDKNTFSVYTNQNLYDGKGNGTTDIVYLLNNNPREYIQAELCNENSVHHFDF